MELFIWLWVFDKKLLCGLGHHRLSVIYIWLVPVICAATTLLLSYFFKTMDARDMRKCFVDNTVAENGRILSKLALIQEGLLVCIIGASIAVIVQADREARKNKPSKALPMHNPQILSEKKTVAYNFWQRTNVL